MKRYLVMFGLVAALAPVANAADALGALTYSGDQSALQNVERDLAAAQKDPAKLAALEQRLLDVLRRSDATFAARQAAAQRLGLVLAQSTPKTNVAALRPLAAMLTDENDSDVARLALEPAPGAAIDQLFLDALPRAAGRAKLGIIDSLARRHVAAAVAPLATAAKSADNNLAIAAIRALGEIGGADALAALRDAPAAHAREIAAAKLAIASRLDAPATVPLLQELERTAPEPAQRAAALRLLLTRDPSGASTRVAELLSGTDWTQKEAAFEAMQTLPPAAALTVASTAFSRFDAATQAVMLGFFARHPDPAATSLLVTAARSDVATVRFAAIEALASATGTRETAALLGNLAASDDATEAKAARQSLARQRGADTDATITAGAKNAEARLRSVWIDQLALRNMTESLPLLLSWRGDADPKARAAAAAAIGELGGANEQAALLEWTLAATDEAEQAKALAALVKLTLRLPDAASRAAPIHRALEQAPPETAARLMPALARLGDSTSAELAARFARGEQPVVAQAAVETLARWPDRTALSALGEVAEKSPVENVRTSAVHAALRSLERSRERWTPELTRVFTQLAAGAADTDTRKRLLAQLARANDPQAVAVAQTLGRDPALADDARETAEIVGANAAGEPALRASDAEGSLRNILDGRPNTRWSVPANGNEWLQIDFHLERPLHRLTLDQTGRAAEFPERYELYVTNDPASPGAVRASGAGQRNKTVIDLPAGTRGRYVILKNTAERADVPWTICDLVVE